LLILFVSGLSGIAVYIISCFVVRAEGVLMIWGQVSASAASGIRKIKGLWT